MAKTEKITEVTASQAKRFFLRHDSYCNIDLPPYFSFESLLKQVSDILDGKNLSDFQSHEPKNFVDLNYIILNNKDGHNSWRRYQLIHPALYVSLVHILTSMENWKAITERFKNTYKVENIACASIPLLSSTKKSNKSQLVNQWCNEVEQKSIELSLDFPSLTHADISNCYSSIYTHAIAWAIHDKEFVKNPKNRANKSLLGNKIDYCVSSMSHGQTNGIPEGSTLMDFLAEIVLGYADHLLFKKIEGRSSIGSDMPLVL